MLIVDFYWVINTSGKSEHKYNFKILKVDSPRCVTVKRFGYGEKEDEVGKKFLWDDMSSLPTAHDLCSQLYN